jgi:hypothetical protein
MPPKCIKIGLVIRADTLKARPSIVGQSFNNIPVGQHINGTVMERCSAKSRSWKVRWDVDNLITEVSSRLLFPLNSNSAETSLSLSSSSPSISQDPEDEDSEDSNSEVEEEDIEEEVEEQKIVGEDEALLCPHGKKWNVLEEILPDSRRGIPGKVMDLRWHLLNASVIEGSLSFLEEKTSYREPLHYFFLSFPIAIIHPIVARTNQDLLKKKEANKVQHRISMNCEKLLKIFGILYLMSLYPLSNRRMYFQKQENPLLPSFDFGKFMPEYEFETLLSTISWSNQHCNDDWRAIRDLVTAFNKRRLEVVHPSDKLVVDESMSSNKTNRTIKNSFANGLPHQTKIARKPEGIGIELRTLIDGNSEVMLSLEIQHNKENMRKMKYTERCLAGTASLLRLVEPYFQSNRTVYADSAFASVATAEALAEKSLFFMGIVKTASRSYPKKFFKVGLDASPNLLRSGRSQFLADENKSMIAVGWYDKKLKTILSTCGVPGMTSIHERVRYRMKEDGTTERFIKSTPIDLITQEYFKYANKIDVHNHRRQGEVELERVIHTHSWSLRLASTILGIVLVDAYMMYKYELESESREQQLPAVLMSFRDFQEKIALELSTNTWSSSGKARKRYGSRSSVSDSKKFKTQECRLELISRHENYRLNNDKTQLRCRICHEKCSWYCIECSIGDTIVSLCGPGAIRAESCLKTHQEVAKNISV